MARPPAEEWSSRRYRQSRRFKSAARAIGLKVRQLRDEKGLTLEKAAELADMDLTHWQKIEAGSLNPTLVTLLRIADALGEPLELFGSRGPPARRRRSGRGDRWREIGCGVRIAELAHDQGSL